jgi:sulfate transport system ATP-binding protein
VLLLDEPFGALDAKVRKDLRRWLRELHDRTGHTTVFVTHDQEEALELADRVAILNAGKLEQIGSTDEIYDNPASPFVMSFVGDTSSIPIERDGGQLLHEGRAFEAKFEGTCQGRGRLYVRPKDIAITGNSPGRLTGTILNVHRTAAGHRAQIAIGAGRIVVEAEVDLGKKVVIGEPVGVQIDNGRVFAD